MRQKSAIGQERTCQSDGAHGNFSLLSAVGLEKGIAVVVVVPSVSRSLEGGEKEEEEEKDGEGGGLGLTILVTMTLARPIDVESGLIT